ncbi:sugar ABC transporter permease [Devosia epidermidihirudinis]|uniref:Sugar ABC transporter permease n=1 Tax=Devosia epidermidihirudinis TaxID=1293439 RepID=A0A0F5QBK2_9HYPH|nr:sugar ABC transporter permease [Devosia epidermidihirudinis]KKC38071.1 sugar ABC transporter permease [Devosia epidermidihirudinis]
MALRWSRWSPQLALVPAIAVTLVAFVGGIIWTVYLSLTRSRRIPEYTIDWSDWFRQYDRLFRDDAWAISLQNLIILGIGSALAIVFGFVLAAMIDRERRGESFFRTVFLYPLAISLIVTGAAWRWIFNPEYGVEPFLHSLGLTWVNASWLSSGETAMWAIILASVWQSSGFYMALMLAGLKSINSEIWSAARLDGVSLWKLYTQIIIPMMKFTFVTCAILLSLGVIKAYDVVVAMTNGGPGQSTYVPAFFTIQAMTGRGNLGFASAAAVMMLVITAIVFLPLVLLTAWQQRRSARIAK